MPKGRKWKPEEIEKVRRYVAKGLTHSEIGEKIGRSGDAVNIICSRNGIKAPREFFTEKQRRSQGFTFTKEEIEEIRADVEDDKLSNQEIAAKYFITTDILRRLGKEQGFPKRKPGVPTSRRNLKVIDFSTLFRMYFEECDTLDNISKRLGVHRSVVRRSLETHGMDIIKQSKRKKLRDEFKDTGKLYKQINEVREAR